MHKRLDIGSLTSLDPEIKAEVKELAAGFFTGGDAERAELISRVISQRENAKADSNQEEYLIELAALFFDNLLSYLLQVRCSHESKLSKFFTLLNHMPILENSPYYSQVMQWQSLDEMDDTDKIKRYNLLQTLHIFTELGDTEAALKIAHELEAQISIKQIRQYILFQLSMFKIYSQLGRSEERIRLLLTLAAEVYCIDGAESAIYLILRWVSTVSWLRSSILHKAILMRIYEEIGNQKCLNSAIVTFSLFSMDDRLVSPTEKMSYYRKLVKYPPSTLNSHQLHELHFFAGNYSSGLQAKFQDSIQSFQYSNYFLHKCWERLIEISKFLRGSISPEQYVQCMPFLEKHYLHLSHHTSMQSNSYVENLQANYETIEELYQKVGELSLTDGLTGLRNRRYMDNNLMQFIALASRHKVPVCFAMVDIDLFKLVNDSYGHSAGDAVLKELAEILIAEFRTSDIIIRYGGDEFIIVLFDLDMELSTVMMEKLRDKIASHPFKYKNHVISVTVSIGITCNKMLDEPEYSTLGGFITNSDEALYKAKNAGRNTVTVFKCPKNPA